MRAVLDTSVFIARERERPLGELPAEVGVSVVTLSELRHGVLAAADHARRAKRLGTLEAARRLGQPLAIDEAVGDELARLRVALTAIGRAMRVMDAWIAATAIAHSAAVCTQDADFEAVADAGLVRTGILLDDRRLSGWTLAMVGGQLRQAGAQAVVPVALATLS